ncbi:hypothetical protein SLEP1_g3105 [Rubroshorea leprosula]|uniref:C2H2-type domain-containing protein n=1 Tax=Rubroshorea leprosula TaxID=152421 RepID=A0AAV5HJQ9_9ROSI|nr:hypothetical protein SLEP1_g3105 [Rubroshorea leprosula]
MALITNPHSGFKYHCRVCKKGFACGRALGGHMRSHGITSDHRDDLIDEDEDHDHASDWDWEATTAAPANKRMYALRANPNRLKTCRACENCGKEFSSWKSFLEHGKCRADDVDESLMSDNDDEEYGVNSNNWSKKRRSFRAKVGNYGNCPSSEEIDLANCLMMLSNAIVDQPSEMEPEESCASASKDEERIRNYPSSFVAPVSYGRIAAPPPSMDKAKAPVVPKGLFECKACKKMFTSHQALGGHRASHKKVKGCFATKLDGMDGSLEEDHDELFPTVKSMAEMHLINRGATSSTPFKRKHRGHECSVCHRVFSSGQALGGHKRCHWITSNSPTAPVNTTSPIKKLFDHSDQQPLLDLTLDLNLPATDDRAEIYLEPWVGIEPKDQIENSNQNIGNNNEKDHRINELVQKVEDETAAESKVKLAKLSELKDINMNGGSSSSWLQVGIGTGKEASES